MYKLLLCSLLASLLAWNAAALHECALAREFSEDISLATSKFGDVTILEDATVDVENGSTMSIIRNGDRHPNMVVEYFETGEDKILVQVLVGLGEIECIASRRREVLNMLQSRFGRQTTSTCVEAQAENEQTREREFFELCEETEATFGSNPFDDSPVFLAGSFELQCGEPDADNMNGVLNYDFGHNIIISGDVVIDNGEMVSFEWEDVPPPPGKSAFGSELILHLMLDKAVTKVFEGLTELRSHLEYVDNNLPVWEERAGEEYDYPFIGLNRIAESTWDFYTCMVADPCDCKPDATGEESMDWATVTECFNEDGLAPGPDSNGTSGSGSGGVHHDDGVTLDHMVTIS